MTGIGCFKAYDIRGRVPNELDPILARAVGAGFADMFDAQRIVIGRDVRPSGAELSGALSQGLRAMGAEVLDIGICGTEEIYHATALLEADGGIMVTASHNPPEYNGMKFVRQGAKPVSADTGLMDLARWVEKNPDAGNGTARGALREIDVRPQYIRHILSLVNTDAIRPMRVVVNAGNGCAGPVFDALSAHLPLSVTRLAHEPDGSFPNGVPNPLLIENRQWTSQAVRETGADLGIAWDGDFDRCFLFDETGRFVEGYYLVGLLAAAMLRDHPGSRVVHDPRLVWNTR
jgi:phosphomannomutase